MDSFINTRKLLESDDPEKIKKALLMLNKGNHPELKQEIEKLLHHEDSTIKSITNTIIRNYKRKSDDFPPDGIAVEELMQLPENLETFYNMFKSLQKSNQKIWLMKKLNVYSVKPQEQEFKLPFIELYLKEQDRGICHLFSKILIKWFGAGVQRIFIENLNEKNWDIRINCIIGLMKFNSQEGVEKVTELYEETNNIDFIYFASCYLWKYSHLLVISKLKEIVHESQNHRVLAANICSALRHTELQGIITFLLEDKSELVRSRAKLAFSKIERTLVEKNKTQEFSQVTDDFLQKFRVILKHSHDFQKKIMVMKIIDNLGKKEFIDIIETELKNEKNHFLISSYVKFLGKHGGNDYIEKVKPYLDSKDDRIVANCLEGLSYCKIDVQLSDLFLRFIKEPNHRISSISAMALWNNGQKTIVKDYIDHNIKNSKLWIRKSLINILQQINSPELLDQIHVLCNDTNKEIRKCAKSLVAEFEKKTGIADSPKELIQFILDKGKIPDRIIHQIITTIKSADKSMQERLQAIEFLSYIATDEHYKKIYRLYMGAHDPVMKAALVKTLGIIFSGGLEFLLDILKENYDSRILASALEGLNFYDCSLYTDDIFPFLYHEDRRVVASAAVLLYEIMPEEILRKFSVMIDSPSDAVRKSSIFALAEIKTYESYLLIRKLLNDSELEIAISASKIVSIFDRETDFLQRFEREKESEPSKPSISIPSDELKTDLLIEYFNKLESSTIEELSGLISEISSLVNSDNIDFLLSYIETSQNEDAKAKILSLLGNFLDIPRVYDLVDTFLGSGDFTTIKNILNGFEKVSEKPYFLQNLIDFIASGDASLQELSIQIIMSNPFYGKEVYRQICSKDPDIRPLLNYFAGFLPARQPVPEEPAIPETEFLPGIKVSAKVSEATESDIIMNLPSEPAEDAEIPPPVTDHSLVVENLVYILKEMSHSMNNDELPEILVELEKTDMQSKIEDITSIIENSKNRKLVLALCSVIGKYSTSKPVFFCIDNLLKKQDVELKRVVIESLSLASEPAFYEELIELLMKDEFAVRKSVCRTFLHNRLYGDRFYSELNESRFQKWLKSDKPAETRSVEKKEKSRPQAAETVPKPAEPVKNPPRSNNIPSAFLSFNMKQTFVLASSTVFLLFLCFSAGYLSSGTLLPSLFQNRSAESAEKAGMIPVAEFKSGWLSVRKDLTSKPKIIESLTGYLNSFDLQYGPDTFYRVKNSLKDGDIKTADEEFNTIVTHIENGDFLKDPKKGKWTRRKIVEKSIFEKAKSLAGI